MAILLSVVGLVLALPTAVILYAQIFWQVLPEDPWESRWGGGANMALCAVALVHLVSAASLVAEALGWGLELDEEIVLACSVAGVLMSAAALVSWRTAAGAVPGGVVWRTHTVLAVVAALSTGGAIVSLSAMMVLSR